MGHNNFLQKKIKYEAGVGALVWLSVTERSKRK